VDNVDDTGILLRAFLPLPDAPSRENIRSYSGKTIVLDARVICQPPRLTDLQFNRESSDRVFLSDVVQFSGNYGPSRNITGVWADNDYFNCRVLLLPGVMNICQPGRQNCSAANTTDCSAANTAGGLVSTFSNMTDTDTIVSISHEFIAKGYAQVDSVMYGVPFLPINSSMYLANDTGDGQYPWDNYTFSGHDVETYYAESGP
jgi:hypothetical protein